MKVKVKQTRVGEDVQPTSARARTETSHSGRETTYWGVLCRTCRELVAFDICPYASFGPEAASMRPGAIRCGQGHNHIYFPRDFRFNTSEVAISDAVMLRNRDMCRAINSSGQHPSYDF